MRIAVVHSFYSSVTPSGENTVVLEQVDALSAAGHDVLLVARYTDDDSRESFYPLRAAARVITGRGPDPSPELVAFDPDVVHVHNLFPNFGSSWLRSWHGPVVATLHNFRPVCANGLLFRDGHYCEECPTGSNLSAVRHACYRGSHLASVPLAIRNARGPKRNDVLARSDALICLSAESAALYRRLAGEHLPLTVIPNAVGLTVPTGAPPSNGRWLVVSRLSPEKGVRELVESWPDGEQLDIIGTGPEEARIAALKRVGVQLLGGVPREKVLAAMPHYLGLIFPSTCIEMQPTVLIEAMGSALPVVARRTSSAAGAVESANLGMTYADAEDLRRALAGVTAQRASFSHASASFYTGHFSRQTWLTRISALYGDLTMGYRR